MPSAIAVILLVLWGLGLATSHTMGGFIHVLLAASAAIFLYRAFMKQKADKVAAATRLKKKREMIRRAGRY